MKKTNLILLLAIAVFLTIGMVSIYYGSFKVIAVKNYDMHVTVDNKLAFNLGSNNETIFFGRVVPKGTVSKIVNITNNYDAPVKTQYRASGEIVKMLVLPQSLMIDPGVTRSLEFSVSPPENALLGNYTGELKILLLKT